jgi:formyl-CoA transferase
MESYKASDGDIVLAVGNDKMWRKLVELMGMPQLLEMPEFETVHKRVQNRKPCKEFIEQWTMKKTVADLVETLLAVGIPAAPIYNIAQVCTDPHIAGARNMFVEFDHPVAGKVKVTNSAIRMSETDACVKVPAPVLGQDNEDVYQNVFGFLPTEIEDFRNAGII